MANILSLAMKVSADASGVVKNLTPAERALEKLGQNADKLTSVFDQFAGSSEAAANAQRAAAESFDALVTQLQGGEINAKQFAEAYANLGKEIEKETKLLQRASEITRANISPLERYTQAVDELNDQLRAGRISQETYNRALEKAQRDLDKTSDNAKKADTSLESLARNTKILAGIELGRLFVGGVQAIANVFRDVANRVTTLVSSVNSGIDSLTDLSARTGINVEALQGYSLAAKLAGVDTKQFGTAVERLAVIIGKATPGDALDKALKGINLSLADLRALSPEQQFSEIGQAISQLPTAAARAAAAVDIFGKQGAALAPLFREGAASIEELQARAERLGIIISETQVNNVADMNDAFDLVAATINGIVGQVIGNLAPAVTAVTNEFLRFVEEWSGAQGTGGTGIANAITDVLLEGASYFAAIFDKFVEEFGNLGEVFAFSADVFDVTAKVLLSVSEAFRVVFNVLQLGIDALIVGFGKVLEGLGSFVDSDLEEYGRALVDAGMESTERNSREMEAAAANAAETFNSIFTGGDGNAQQAGQGAASQFLAGLRAEIQNARLPEVQVQANLASATAELDQFLSTAEGGASDFLQQSQATLATFSQMAAEGELTADQIEIMNGFMERLNGELVKERKNREDAAAAATAQAEADQKRVDALLKIADGAEKIRDDLAAVEREQSRVAESIASGDLSGRALADAEQRQRQLAELSQKLEEDALAAANGFSEGFDKAFASTDSGLTSLIVKAEEFGPAGAAAAEELRRGIEFAQNQAASGIIPKETYDLEVERQKQLFDNRINQIEEESKFRLKQEEEADKILFAAQFGYDSERAKAAENLELLQSQIRLTEEAIAAARAEGDKQELAVLSQRLSALDQAAQREEDIATGRAKAREEEQKRLQKFQEDQLKAQQQAQQQFAEQQKKIFEEQQKAAEAEAKRQEERLTKLNTLGSQTITGSDIRTAEGAALVLNLTANAQDPRLIQERLQTKLLERIATGIGQAASNYFTQPVAIVGYSSFGEPT
jgi:hypothetical protein